MPQRVSDRALFVSAACVVDMLYSFNTTPVLLICCTLYDSCVMDTVFAADTGVVHCIAVHTVLIRKLQAQLVLLICGTVYDSCVLDTVYVVSCIFVADTGVTQRQKGTKSSYLHIQASVQSAYIQC